MKTILKHLFFTFLFTKSNFLLATAQTPDYLIVGKDTFAIFSNPLEDFYTHETRPNSFFDEKPCYSTACWRDYVAFWKLENQKLYLVKIVSCCSENVVADLKKFFGEKYTNNQVFADWFTGNIISPQGELIYYVHMGYSSVYEKETEYVFEKGVLKSQKEFKNFISKSIYTENSDSLKNFIYSHINWDLFPELENEKLNIKVFATINSSENGKIDSVKIMREENEKYEKEAIRVLKLIPSWEVLYLRGKFIPRKWTIPVIFNKENKEKYRKKR